ncbi:MAG: hypothetical protein FWG98_06655 [Candidatus Cloacimonetes bacterium]|nr:hypothetical protein [Candidatus Cloacimonadota bacterium]
MKDKTIFEFPTNTMTGCPSKENVQLVCDYCLHLIRSKEDFLSDAYVLSCSAFPDKIPDVFYFDGKKHDRPCPDFGQKNDIIFELNHERLAWDLECIKNFDEQIKKEYPYILKNEKKWIKTKQGKEYLELVEINQKWLETEDGKEYLATRLIELEKHYKK